MTVSFSISFCFNIKHNLYVLEKYCYLVIARIYTFRTQAHAYPECFARHDENSCKLFALLRLSMDHPRPVNHFYCVDLICVKEGSLNKDNRHLFSRKICTYYFDEKMPPRQLLQNLAVRNSNVF